MHVHGFAAMNADLVAHTEVFVVKAKLGFYSQTSELKAPRCSLGNALAGMNSQSVESFITSLA